METPTESVKKTGRLLTLLAATMVFSAMVAVAAQENPVVGTAQGPEGQRRIVEKPIPNADTVQAIETLKIEKGLDLTDQQRIGLIKGEWQRFQSYANKKELTPAEVYDQWSVANALFSETLGAERKVKNQKNKKVGMFEAAGLKRKDVYEAVRKIASKLPPEKPREVVSATP
jgi:hypothetical protein